MKDSTRREQERKRKEEELTFNSMKDSTYIVYSATYFALIFFQLHEGFYLVRV
ncbi:hypothetical protein Mcup_1115 [Metallosphaera cuprina Ar-4]|uniref:Uncharacterized protein n=1 Tax=Metallosphaera cuprina (strain Ar-4) TaxID=1006006 RepID=F4G322_METCR|nr:hypothetical protein Mcup_1115 [Metallosphaera cuprina Ar-4]